jgi:hypothetical protein
MTSSLAWFPHISGDTAEARRMAAPYVMPRSWGLRRVDCTAEQLLSGSWAVAEEFLVDSILTLDATRLLPAPWRRIPESAFEPLGMHAELVANPEHLRSSDVCEIRTAVIRDTACEATIMVTLPAPHGLWLNGKHIASVRPTEVELFDNAEEYPWQRLIYDAERHPVHLRPGLNTISVLYIDEWVTNPSLHRFRVALASTDGTPL